MRLRIASDSAVGPVSLVAEPAPGDRPLLAGPGDATVVLTARGGAFVVAHQMLVPSHMRVTHCRLARDTLGPRAFTLGCGKVKACPESLRRTKLRFRSKRCAPLAFMLAMKSPFDRSATER